MVSISDAKSAVRFAARLPSFLWDPVSLDEARATLRRRLEQREADFLALARRAIFEHAGSPYRQLLAWAGCEYGDLERLVRQEGVEGTLSILYRHGVYLSTDEFKGRQPAIRGSATIEVDTEQLINPCSAFHVAIQSSGSRGKRTLVPIDLAWVRDGAVNTSLVLDARNATEWCHAVWGVPGSSFMIVLLEFGGAGLRMARWFSQVDPAAPGLDFRYRWSARMMRWTSLLAGAPLPRPVHVPLDDSLPIASWMAEVLRNGVTPHLRTFASSAVRLCQTALGAGMNLAGARFTLVGEPLTAARLSIIRRTGAEAVPSYGSSEAHFIGHGCLAPEAPDEVHLLQDRAAVIQPGQDGEAHGFPANAVLVSSLRPAAPLILVNVSLGDQAIMTQRACGCPLERLGWSIHLHTIRSYEKLTAGGITFLDMDVIRVLEEVLPARFGGAPTDYQLLENETEDGYPRLSLRVHPAVGPLDTNAVAKAFVAAIGTGRGAQRVASLLWQDADFLRVERAAPQPTSLGKILHLHVGRPAPR